MTKIRTLVRKMFGRLPADHVGVDVNTTHGLTLAGPGLALRGYDPVAYFTKGTPVIGKATYFPSSGVERSMGNTCHRGDERPLFLSLPSLYGRSGSRETQID